MIKIRELITTNLSALSEPKVRVFITVYKDGTIAVYIDMPKYLYIFYNNVILRIHDQISSKTSNIDRQCLVFFPENKHHICHFYYNDIQVDCSDEYKNMLNITDDELNSAYSRDKFVSWLKRSIENRLNKLMELYSKVNIKEISNSVDNFVKNIVSNEITIKPKYSTDELDEIPDPYPPVGDFPQEPEKPKCRISSEDYRTVNWTKKRGNKMIIEPGWSAADNLDGLLQQDTKSKPSPYTFTRDPDLDNLIEKITGVLKQITLRNDLSEETYKIKSIPRDIDKLISVYLNMSTEDRKNKKQELQKAIEAMLKVAVDYYEMVKCESVSELNVELKFIEHKYK